MAGAEEEAVSAVHHHHQHQKPRLSESDISFILATKSERCPTAEDFSSTLMRADDTWRRHLAEKAAVTEEINALWEEFRADVAAQLAEKGYVEVDVDYFEERAKSEAWVREQWATLDWSKFDVYKDGDELEGFMRDYEEGMVVDYGLHKDAEPGEEEGM